MTRHSLPADRLPPGSVGRAGPWTVVNRDGEVSAVSSRCRHQLADLSKGTLDADGCLVCPWHGSAFDVTTGRMRRGPRGFFGYHGPVPGYAGVVRAYSQLLRLRTRRARRVGDDVVVD